ncbi:MAG: VOC family protein [Nocardioides sp.]
MTVVRPVRFTDDIPAMQAFLEGLGLQRRISSNRPGWVDLAGARGLVALHSARDSTIGARHGETRLSFELADADATTQSLREAGFDASVIDESWGRTLELTDPDGRTMLCDERSDDLYGYTAHRVDATRPGPVVVPICHTGDTEAYGAMLWALGVGPDEVEVRACGEPQIQLSFLVIDPDGQTIRIMQR